MYLRTCRQYGNITCQMAVIFLAGIILGVCVFFCVCLRLSVFVCTERNNQVVCSLSGTEQVLIGRFPVRSSARTRTVLQVFVRIFQSFQTILKWAVAVISPSPLEFTGFRYWYSDPPPPPHTHTHTHTHTHESHCLTPE
jgi:hypothetical protein